MKKVVTIGGGTGSYVLLRGLKEFPISITAVVNMFDSGGSSGILRDELGVLPPGDVRRALLALSEGPQTEIIRELFQYRFSSGTGLTGHNFGNLLLVALSSMYGGDAEGIEKASELLNIKGKVFPVSVDTAHVHAILEDGQEIVGETNIDIPKHNGDLRITDIFLDPVASLYTPAQQAILDADIVVICPGDLYSSLIPTLLTKGMSDALNQTKAHIVWVSNIMTKWGETDNFTASDFARELTHYSGIEKFDTIIWNSKSIAEEVQEQYARERQHPVELDESELLQFTSHILRGDFLSNTDLVRYDSHKIAKAIVGLS